VPVIVVALTTVAAASAAPRKVADAPLTKPEPLIVTAVPPRVDPLAGETLVTVGAGAGGGAVAVPDSSFDFAPSPTLLTALTW